MAPIAFGSELRRDSTTSFVERKAGRTGSLVFVTLEHRCRADGDLALVERQHIVYREPSRVTRFAFRAQRPLFADRALRLHGRPTPGGATFWAADDAGEVAMTASVEAA